MGVDVISVFDIDVVQGKCGGGKGLAYIYIHINKNDGAIYSLVFPC